MVDRGHSTGPSTVPPRPGVGNSDMPKDQGGPPPERGGASPHRGSRDPDRAAYVGAVTASTTPPFILPSVSRVALVAGGFAFAVAGSSIWGEPALGSPASGSQIAVAILSGLLLIVGVIGVSRSRRATAPASRLWRWGIGLVMTGLIAHVVGSTLGLLGPALPDGPGAVIAIVAVPAWILAHLAYIGTTLVGLAIRRSGAFSRALTILLIACTPLLLVGVPGGLALESIAGSGVSSSVAWLATEGQFGLGWLLVGLAGMRSRRG